MASPFWHEMNNRPSVASSGYERQTRDLWTACDMPLVQEGARHSFKSGLLYGPQAAYILASRGRGCAKIPEL